MTFEVDSKPRHFVFSKIENLIKLMQDQITGIQLKNKKILFGTIPGAFTGNELIVWLTSKVCDDNYDSEEALHIATFLCNYGYIYPLDLKNFTVRDDKSIHYKFQAPCYWPSKNLKLSKEKYIIYLLKRSKRNKKKHGLDEYEQNALQNLQIVFSDKMAFLNKQAEEQVKYVKEMKRDDKVLHDLQERVFWRVNRPPPNHAKYLEEGPSRYFQPSQMISRRRTNKDLKLKEVQYLRKAIGKPRMKLSKSLEIFFQRNEQYLEYDPFLDTRAVQPSNPWISEDETLWNINRGLIDVPTITRIKKWGLSFEDLLKDETGRREFEMFLKKEYSQENIRFYKACKELIIAPNSQVSKWKVDIERNFLTPGAVCEVNIDCKTMDIVMQRLKADNNNLNTSRYIFQPAMDHVYALMKKDSYSRFLRSDQYKTLLETAQNHYPKKRFFNFGGSNRKKTPSPQVRRRGSTSSDKGAEGDLGGTAYHSFSTGNLQELDDKPKRSLSAVNRQSNSPSLRRRADDTLDKASSKDGRRRSNLDVPRANFSPSSSDPSRKSESLSPCLALNVPRTNVVTPWEGGS